MESMELIPMLVPTEPTPTLPTVPTPSPTEPITSASVRLRPSPRLTLLSSTMEPMELTPMPTEPITSASVRLRLRPSLRLTLLSSTMESMELTPTLPTVPTPMPMEPTLTWDKLFICKTILLRVSYLLPALPVQDL